MPAPGEYQKYILTGGSNGLVFLAVLFGALLSAYGREKGDQLQDLSMLTLKRRLLVSSFLFIFLPQSMEMRYYMITLFVRAGVCRRRANAIAPGDALDHCGCSMVCIGTNLLERLITGLERVSG